MKNNVRQLNSGGFTLVETSIAAVLMVVLGAGILGLQYTLGKTQITAYSSVNNSNEANDIVLKITREMRTARSGDNGAFLIESGAGDSIVFFTDADYDGTTEKVQYTRSGTTLTRYITEPTGYPVTYPTSAQTSKVLSTNIRNGVIPVFAYYNGDWPTVTTGNPLPTPVDLLEVKLVHVYIRSNDLPNASVSDFIAQSYATIRMAKDNL